ncbi:MAG: hypothetical protein SZ59_C0002G0030 [candidate division TM6 bacterium GW2011_GWF2_28_16]|nr:MAG: hypothetical protein SZ59_C0002G0030 [candidate division TM6 bacterium GW2011_GWF2_28_16]
MGCCKLKKLNIFEILFIIFIFGFISLWFYLEQPKIQRNIITKLVNILEQEWDSKITINSYKINFLTGKIYLNYGKLLPKNLNNKTCFWSFLNAEVKFSRLNFLLKNYFLLDINLKNIEINSDILNNKLLIQEHFKTIFLSNTSDLAKLRALNIKNIKLNLILNNKNNINLDLNCNLGFKNGSGFLNCKNGNIFYNNLNLIKNLEFSSILNSNTELDLDGNFNLNLPEFSKSYKIIINKKIINLFDNNNNLELVIDLVHKNEIKITGISQILLIKNLINILNINNNFNMQFDALSKFNLVYSNKKLQGNLKLLNINNNLLKDLVLNGDIFLDFKENNFKINLFNYKNIKLFNLLELKDKAFNINFDLIKNTGNFSLEFNSSFINKTTYFKGSILLKNNKLNLMGNNLEDKFIFNINLSPELYFEKILYLKNGLKFIDLNSKNKIISGDINFNILKTFIPINIKNNILGSFNSCKIALNQQDCDNLSGNISFGNGKISILKNYNPIENINFNFLFENKINKLFVNNLLIQFLKGNIAINSTNNSYILFDDSLNIQEINLPLKINNFLFNLESNFYALLDGNLNLLKNKNNSSKLSGKLIFKKSFLNGDILNIDRKNKFIANDLTFAANNNLINLDIDLVSEKMLKLKGGLFNLDILVDLNLKGFVSKDGFLNPELIGNLDIKSGTLNFLEKKLFINYGKIQFLPNNFSNPIIDLDAKNKIDKYLINLQITGFLDNPKIILDSSPKLDKKQILGILLSGSNDINLESQLSLLLNKNLKNIGSNKFSPFRYVKITPNFVNNIADTGFTGSIDIGLNDQLHAKLQKDFTLEDDFAMQLDYFLTDDVNFRLLKDQRDELGAQVEVRLRL